MWGFAGILIVWPLLCLPACWFFVWSAKKFVTQEDWEQTKTPSKWDDTPPPKWHYYAQKACVILGFLWLWFSLPLSVALTAGR
jgi:hypothetical protein